MDICIDTRHIKPGQVFIPVKGPNFDGRDFIDDAIKKGARVLDVDLNEYAKKYRQKLKCHVIGITGSAGKTTVKDMLKAVLSKQFNVVATHENENNEVGAPLTVLRADSSTEILLVEMGMRGKGQIKSLAQIVRPTHIIITQIGLTHVEILKTQRNIALAKSEIMQKPLKWEGTKRRAFLNEDTPYYDLLKEKAKKADYLIHPFPGKRKVDVNVNICFEVGRHFGLDDDTISEAMTSVQRSEHRLKRIPLKNAVLIDDTYNSNPDGVLYALEYIKGLKGRKIVVFGDMLELGSYSKKAHKNVVNHAIDHHVSCMFTYGKETEVMTSTTIPIQHYDTKDALVRDLRMEIKEGDIILVKGSRGLKMESIVNELRHHLG